MNKFVKIKFYDVIIVKNTFDYLIFSHINLILSKGVNFGIHISNFFSLLIKSIHNWTESSNNYFLLQKGNKKDNSKIRFINNLFLTSISIH